MIMIQTVLNGSQTGTHCSMSSSIGYCEMLNTPSERCRMYKKRVEYDHDAHAYKRCEECLKAEIK